MIQMQILALMDGIVTVNMIVMAVWIPLPVIMIQALLFSQIMRVIIHRTLITQSVLV